MSGGLKASAAAEAGHFVAARALYPVHRNPMLAKAGITNIDQFIAGLEAHLRRFPELQRVAQVAAEYRVTVVLSGGTARTLIGDYLRDLEAGAADTGPKTLLSLLEAQDTDLLVTHRDGSPVDQATCERLGARLNRESGAALVGSLPSVARRNYAVEWDVQDAQEFLKLKRAYGGEALNNVGIGLDTDGTLILFDPLKQFDQFFTGKFDYTFGSDPYRTDMVVRGQFDPSLDGLRLIRAIVNGEDVGCTPSEQAQAALKALGDEADRRAFEVQARVANSERIDGKLPRRWRKYVAKIWWDAHHPEDAVRLLDQSGYAQLLTKLGLKQTLLQQLASSRPVPQLSDAPEVVAVWVVRQRDELEALVTDRVPTGTYLWSSRKMAAHLLAGGHAYGRQAGPVGAGLYLADESLPDTGPFQRLLKVDLGAGRVVDLRDKKTARFIAAYLKVAVPALRDAHKESLAAEADASSAALDYLLGRLGIDIIVCARPFQVVARHAGVVKQISEASDLNGGLLQSLKAGTCAKPEMGVRALVALKRLAGLEEALQLLESRQVDLAALFPATATRSLFEDVAFVSKECGDRLLEVARQRWDALSPAQRVMVQRAAVYLSGGLPAELVA